MSEEALTLAALLLGGTAPHAEDGANPRCVLSMGVPFNGEDVPHTAIRAILADLATERARFGFVPSKM